MSPRILLAEPMDFSPKAEGMLRALGDVEKRALARGDRDAWHEAFAGYDVVWFRLAHRIDAGVLGEQPRCRVLATPVTGLDHIDLDACAARGVRVVSLRGEVAFLEKVRATAELTVGLMIALLRRVPQAAADVVAGHWERDRFRGGELFEKTVGVVGVGRLGTIVARILRAFGCRVLGFDPRDDFPEGAVDVRCASLDELLTQSDIVTLHVAYKAAGPGSTRHLIGESAFAKMKPGAIVVNTSRGGLVDEAALLRALEAGTLAGAALDVLEGEPGIDGNHAVVAAARGPLADRLLVVPHIGGNTRESFEKTEVFLAGRVAQALGGPA